MHLRHLTELPSLSSSPDDSHKHWAPVSRAPGHAAPARRQQCPYSQTYLWLVADQNIVLHGVGDVVDVELQVRPLRDPYKSYARP